MSKFTKFTHVFIAITASTLQSQSAYRGAALMWVVNGFIIPIILMGVWLTIRQANQLPMDDSQIITYYITSIFVVRLTQSWTGERLSYRIKDGAMSQYLVRPISYWVPGLSFDTGLRLIRIFSLLPFTFIFFFIFRSSIQLYITPASVTLFAISLTIGYFLNFFMQNIVGLTAFWLEHAYGANSMYQAFSALFNGSLIPALLMPPALLAIALYTPFWYVVGFPIEIIMGTLNSAQITQGFQVATIWIFVLGVLWRWEFNQGVRNYTSVGI